MSRLAAAVLAVAVVGLAGLARADDPDKKDEKEYPKLLLGKWEITKAGNPKGAQKGTVLEFAKGGKFKAVIKVAGQSFDAEGTYTVEKDTITAKYTVNGEEGKEVSVIKKLTKDALEIEDTSGAVDVLKKLDDRKDDKKKDEK